MKRDLFDRLPMDRLEFHPWRLSSVLGLEDRFDVAGTISLHDAAIASEAASPIEKSLGRDVLVPLVGLAKTVGRSRIVDASGPAPSSIPVARAHELLSMGPIYVHLGLDAHPSPVFRCGIEGAYIQFVESTARTIAAKCHLVASPDIEPSSALPRPFVDLTEMLRQQLRVVALDVEVSSGAASTSSNAGAWSDFVSAPLQRVVDAAMLHSSGSSEVVSVRPTRAGEDGWRLNVLSRSEPGPYWRARSTAVAVASPLETVGSILAKIETAQDVFVRRRVAVLACELLDAIRSSEGAPYVPADLQDAVSTAFSRADRNSIDHIVLMA